MKTLSPTTFQKTLLTWFSKHGRKHLPWKKNNDAYAIWLSEVMLQQTQVATVIPYFERFMQHFPNIHSLANAHLDEVLHLWSGLGYYSRARNLQRSAQIICEQWQGRLPCNPQTLEQLPGIGRSTAAAIVAFAYQQPATILDGNVKRLFSRLYAISGVKNSSQVTKQLWDIATRHTPKQYSADYTQAIIDFGATVCTPKKAQCNRCPFQTDCLAYQREQVYSFPQKAKTRQIPNKQSYWLILFNEQRQVLLEKRHNKGVWQGLWSFPDCPIEDDLTQWCQTNYSCDIHQEQTLPSFRHTFSHYHWQLTPIIATAKSRFKIKAKQQRWQHPTKPCRIGLAQPVKRLLEQLMVARI